MKCLKILFMGLISFGIVFTLSGWAQQKTVQGKGSGGWRANSPYGKLYNPKTVETIVGEVISVERFCPLKGMNFGLSLVMKTDQDTLTVHLGPEWYLENQDLTLEPKDRVEIKGSKITFEGKPVLIAAEVKKGEEILKLRDENGFPFWSGGRQRGIEVGRKGFFGKGSGGWGTGTAYCKLFNPKTVETLVGEVVSVERFCPMKGMSFGVSLVVKTDQDTLTVHLGPEWYLENQDLTLEAKDRVEIKGSKITFEDKTVLIAAEVKKGEDLLKLRDENGFPFWSGVGRRSSRGSN